MQQIFIIYIALLLIILFLIMLAQRLKVSYPIVLVLGGLLISFIPGLPEISINPELIFLIFLPPLLYEAAWYTSWKDFYKWRRVICSFAFGIVILTSGVVALISSSLIPGFTLPLGFLLGGIISPPDAVSATSILKNVKAPKRIVAIIEGESLLNDASSLIVYRFALAAVVTGTFAFHEAVISFFVVIIMGVVTGLLIALVFYVLHRWLPTTASMDTVLTFMAPYTMYIIAEKFHFSGVLAVVTGGLFLSSKSHLIFTHISRIQSINVWETIGFVFNGIVFMLIGLEMPIIVKEIDGNLNEAIEYSLIISATVIILRVLCSLGASVFTTAVSRFITTADNRPGWRGPLIVGWSGMRGVVSLASALSVPLMLANGQAFPQRNMILFITFVVILVTLVFQGLTLPWLIRWLHEPEKDYTLPRHKQEAIIKTKLRTAALALLNDKYSAEVNNNELLQSLKIRLEREISYLDNSHNHSEMEAFSTIESYNTISRELLKVQRSLLHQINKKAEFEEEIIRKYTSQMDLEEEKIHQQFGI